MKIKKFEISVDNERWYKVNMEQMDRPNVYSEHIRFLGPGGRTVEATKCIHKGHESWKVWETAGVDGAEPTEYSPNYYSFLAPPGKLLRAYLRYLDYMGQRDCTREDIYVPGLDEL